MAHVLSSRTLGSLPAYRSNLAGEIRTVVSSHPMENGMQPRRATAGTRIVRDEANFSGLGRYLPDDDDNGGYLPDDNDSGGYLMGLGELKLSDPSVLTGLAVGLVAAWLIIKRK